MKEVLIAVCFLALASVLVGCGGASAQPSTGSYGGADGSTTGYKAPSAMSQQMRMQEGMSRVTRSLML